VIEHVTVYRRPGRFAGWPANYGMWSWGREMVVLLSEGAFLDADKTHKIDDRQPVRVLQGRSLDDGRTWAVEPFTGATPKGRAISADEHASTGRRIGNPYEGENPPADFEGRLDFSSPETVVLVGRSTCASLPEPVFSWFHVSRDRCRTWRGPFRFRGLDESQNLASRTDVIPLTAEHALFMVTCHKSNGREGRVFCAETRDGGRSFRHLAWLGQELADGYEIMPSSVRLPDGRILTATRVGTGKFVSEGCIRMYESADDGRSWTPLPPAVPATGRLSNPPALLQLRDGRLCLVYGFRDPPSGMRARLSADAGRSWSEDIVLRDDGGDHDLGYPRAVLNSEGKVVTAYYYNTDPGSERFIGASIWDAEAEE
jgi:hypothetical protein